MTFNSGAALIAATASGLGMIQVAEYYAWPYLQQGRLVEVLANWKTRAYGISVTFHRGKRIAPCLRVFIDFLVDLFDPPPWRSLPDFDASGRFDWACNRRACGGVSIANRHHRVRYDMI